MTIPLIPFLIPSTDEKDLLYEIQVRLAYSGLLSREESEKMAFGELKWWIDWLINQQKEEAKDARQATQGHKSGSKSKYQSAASRFGFTRKNK